ncbi:hypothetical protein N7504_006282 [Penicillium tannophilum]|nr:hypothetical protein N7504_006282 [Penicillium tannophilum]
MRSPNPTTSLFARGPSLHKWSIDIGAGLGFSNYRARVEY